MAMVVPMAAAGAETAVASGAAAAGTGAGAAGAGAAEAGAAGRGAAGRAGAKSGAKGGAAGGAATSTPRRVRRPASSKNWTPEELADWNALGDDDRLQYLQELKDDREAEAQEQGEPTRSRRNPGTGFDDAVTNSRAYLAAQKARPSQQVAGGLLAAIVIYPVLLNFLKGGSPRVKQWFKAKAFNITSTPGAASTTIQKGTGGGRLSSSTGGGTSSSGTGATGPPVSSSSGSGAGGTAIAFARSHIGDWYLWGATGPKFWDCSGLTLKAFAAAGITIPRTTGDQIKAGRAVKKSELQPGDLVFPNPGHVGIYTGNNMIVHAPHTGAKVREVPLWAFYAARRVT